MSPFFQGHMALTRAAFERDLGVAQEWVFWVGDGRGRRVRKRGSRQQCCVTHSCHRGGGGPGDRGRPRPPSATRGKSN